MHLENQEMAFQSTEVRKSIKVDGSLEDVFKENIIMGTIQTIQSITELRKHTLENR